MGGPDPRRGDDPAVMFSPDGLPDGLLVAGADRRVVVFNRAAVRLTGIARADALGRDFADVLPLHDAEGRDWWKCLDPYGGLSTRSRHPERVLHLNGGTELLVTASYTRERDGGVRAFTVAFRDAVQRARQERNRADLVSTVAHELRSPLTSVKGFTATLLAKWHRFNDDQKRVMLETVNADADRVTRLITELLDVSRIEAGRLEMRRQVVDVVDEVRKVVKGRVVAGEPAVPLQGSRCWASSPRCGSTPTRSTRSSATSWRTPSGTGLVLSPLWWSRTHASREPSCPCATRARASRPKPCPASSGSSGAVTASRAAAPASVCTS